jgi:hypothetical protein
VYRVYVPSVKGIVMLDGSEGMMVRQSSSGPQMYVAQNNAHLRQCYDDANAAVELSAGLAYFANIDLVTHCA